MLGRHQVSNIYIAAFRMLTIATWLTEGYPPHEEAFPRWQLSVIQCRWIHLFSLGRLIYIFLGISIEFIGFPVGLYVVFWYIWIIQCNPDFVIFTRRSSCIPMWLRKRKSHQYRTAITYFCTPGTYNHPKIIMKINPQNGTGGQHFRVWLIDEWGI